MKMTMWARVAIVSTVAVIAGEITPRPAGAQALGYGIAGPVGDAGLFGHGSFLALHAAGGGEVLARGRFGAAGEFGVMAGANADLFITSVNGVLHIGPSLATPVRDRISPFITGGYTLLGSGGVGSNAWNIAAGADVWLKPRVGLRFEVRDHIRPDTRRNVHYWAFRAGVVFR
jgi:hypothetical protein